MQAVTAITTGVTSCVYVINGGQRYVSGYSETRRSIVSGLDRETNYMETEQITWEQITKLLKTALT